MFSRRPVCNPSPFTKEVPQLCFKHTIWVRNIFFINSLSVMVILCCEWSTIAPFWCEISAFRRRSWCEQLTFAVFWCDYFFFAKLEGIIFCDYLAVARIPSERCLFAVGYHANNGCSQLFFCEFLLCTNSVYYFSAILIHSQEIFANPIASQVVVCEQHLFARKKCE